MKRSCNGKIAAGIIALAGMLLCAQGAFAADVKKESFAPNIDVYSTSGSAGKTPLVFLAHNGASRKEDWKEYASDLASEGYVVASISWTDFNDNTDFANAFSSVLAAYDSKIDQSKVAFIGGCHGAVKLARMLKQDANAAKFKALVFLSASEDISIPENHAPALGLYASKDRLGAYYAKKSKEVATVQITKPNRIVEIDSSAHGHELVNDDAVKAQVRGEISSWLKANL